MLNHVTYEVHAERLRECVRFYLELGFYEVAAPASIEADGAIFAHESGLGIHLLVQDEPTFMRWGHVALVPADYGAAIAAMERLGVEVDHRRPYWGAERCFVMDPAGNRVELLASAPHFTPRPPDGGLAEFVQESGDPPPPR